MAVTLPTVMVMAEITSIRPIQQHDFYEELMDPNKTVVESQTSEQTFVIDLTKLRGQRNQKEIEKLDITSHPPQELTETVRIPSASGATAHKSEPEIKIELELEPSRPFQAPAIESTASHDKTLINPVAQQEIQAMQRKKQKEIEAQKAEEERLAREEADRLARAEASKIRALDESTQMIKLDNFGGDLITVAQEEEDKLELEIREIKKKKKLEEQEEDDEEASEQEEEEAKKKKKKIIILLAAVALLYVFLFPNQDKPKRPPFKHLPPQIIFPIPFDKADSKVSKVEYEKGRLLFATGNYVNIVKSGLHLKNAYENDLENSQALNLLVRAYSEQLRYSKEKLVDSQVIFNMIQGKRPFLAKDPNGVIGMNLFYSAIGKHEAAEDVVAKYLKLYPKNVTQDLFAVYLKSLIKVGKLDKAKQFYEALKKATDKNRYGYEALIDFSILNQENEQALNYAKEARQKYPKLVEFYLVLADLMMKEKKLKEVEPLLQAADALNFENNEFYLAKFLQQKGLQFAAKGDVKNATTLFTQSLKLDDSSELRMRLAELSTSDDPKNETEKLIAESKALKQLRIAEDFFEKRRYELAFSAAAKATDSMPGHIPSELFLAKMQLKLGLAKQALTTLEALVKKYPDDMKINFALLDAYIETYKFNDAKNRIAVISGREEIKRSWEFSSINAKLYIQMGDSLQAISWLRNSINANPLNDRDIFLLAEILTRRAKYKDARTLLNRCMELDPVNADYRIAYAKIIHEEQDAESAIGYLLALLYDHETVETKDAEGNVIGSKIEKKPGQFIDNPKVMSEIAILYYQVGKVKDYLEFKEKLEKLPMRDKVFYEFLIKSALNDERYGDIPGLVDELLRIEPGALDAMMTAGRVLFESGKFQEAGKWFLRIQQKMETYPKVQYYIAKIKYFAKDYDGAKADVLKDLKANGDNDVDLALLGLIHSAKGEYVEAENAYKKAQKINSKSYDALIGLAELSTKRNSFDLALDLYKRAMQVKSDEPSIHKKVGDVYRLLGQGGLAVESYKMYLEMSPDAPDKAQVESYINLMQ